MITKKTIQMTIDRVIYFKTFPVGIYWEKVGMEAAISEIDNPQEALIELQKQVQEFFDTSHPVSIVPTTTKVIEPQLSKTEAIIRDINTCKELKVLEPYRLIAAGNSDIQEAYENKLHQLKQK